MINKRLTPLTELLKIYGPIENWNQARCFAESLRTWERLPVRTRPKIEAEARVLRFERWMERLGQGMERSGAGAG